jgi:MYXO-CTERM domain-containing protein
MIALMDSGRSVRGFAILLVASAALAASAEARASCSAVEPRPVKISVATCKAVDAATIEESITKKYGDPAEKYAGTLLTGTEANGSAIEAWIPAAEGADCSTISEGATITGTVDHACCDGDPNPPCLLHTSVILTRVAVAPRGADQPGPSGAGDPKPAPGSRGCGCTVSESGGATAGVLAVAFAIALGSFRRRRSRLSPTS